MKKYKRLAAVFTALIFTLTLSGCCEIKKAESAVCGMFEAFKTLDFEEAQKYVSVDDISGSNAESDESGEGTKLIMETVFGNLNYEILASNKVDKNNVIVKTKITATDMKPVMGEFFTLALQYAFSTAFSDTQPTEEETNQKMEELLVECASKPDLATVTNEVDIKVTKNENKKWQIEVDDSFVSAILGGLNDAANELENKFNN